MTTVVKGLCGHHWDSIDFSDCPVCAMMAGVAVRINDLEGRIKALHAETAQLKEKLRVEVGYVDKYRCAYIDHVAKIELLRSKLQQAQDWIKQSGTGGTWLVEEIDKLLK